MNPVHHTSPLCDASLGPAEVRGEALSCLVDGELPASELDGLLRAYGEDADARANWQAYHLIGEVLRGDSGALVQPTADLVSGIQRRLRSEALPHAPVGVAAVPGGRPAAANDAVFRWKLAAGVASLAAVMAVSWTLLGSAGAPAGAGVQLAQDSDPVAPVRQGPVLVQTDQGQVLRDARLEELLAEHRQYGGMSALQMPAGFLRNATYDAAPQR